MADHELCETFIDVKSIDKGWSSDSKYCVTAKNGKKYLLRVMSISCYESQKALFELLKRTFALGVPMCEPVKIGVCAHGVYTLLGWVDGGDIGSILPALSETEQYTLGSCCGAVLRKIHAIPAPVSVENWQTRFFAVMDERLEAYKDCGVHFDGDYKILDYLRDKRHLLLGRPQTFQHGDFSIGNIMFTDLHEPVVIDWEVNDFRNFGDPWLDFTDVFWAADESPHFSSGLIGGYFDGKPPAEFWDIAMFYVFAGIMTSIRQTALNRPDEELRNEIRLCKEALRWFDDLRNPVPLWYRGNGQDKGV